MGSAEIQGDLWGRAAKDWAGMQEGMHAPLWEAMLDTTGVGAGTTVLDAGCGGGGASVLAASRGAVVSGLDACEPLVDVARDRVPRADFRVGELEALSFADGSFDAVIAASSIQYAEDRVAALRELSRVAKVGARVSVGLFGTADKVDLGAVFAAVRDALPSPPPGAGPFGLSGPGVLEGLIEEAGMNVIAVGEASCPMAFADFDTFWRAFISGGPMQATLEVVGEDDLRAAVAPAVESYRTENGSIRFENVFLHVTAQPTA